MELLPASKLLQDAQKRNYAVPALNVENLERTRAIMEAADESSSPLIVQASGEEVEYGEEELFVQMVKSIGADKDIPVAIHLDHGASFQEAARCIKYGFSSVMYDGAREKFEKNIEVTNKVVELAHAVGVSVEAELGTIGQTTEMGEEIENDYFTDPKSAEEFVDETDVDFLAIAFGTAHGLYDGEPELDFDRLEAIASHVDVPLVMHGGSGVNTEKKRKAINMGIAKINVSTDLRRAFLNRMQEYMEENPQDLMTMNIFAEASRAMKEEVKNVMKITKSAGKA